MRSISMRIRLRSAERRDDDALGEEMQRMETAKRRNGEWESRRFADSMLFGIVQGATFEELRKQSAQAIVELDFDGYAIGGVSVGEPEEEMMRAVESTEPFLPRDKPRYAMGLGTPPQLLQMI